jgi:hypothetical protein
MVPISEEETFMDLRYTRRIRKSHLKRKLILAQLYAHYATERGTKQK